MWSYPGGMPGMTGGIPGIIGGTPGIIGGIPEHRHTLQLHRHTLYRHTLTLHSQSLQLYEPFINSIMQSHGVGLTQNSVKCTRIAPWWHSWCSWHWRHACLGHGGRISCLGLGSWLLEGRPSLIIIIVIRVILILLLLLTLCWEVRLPFTIEVQLPSREHQCPTLIDQFKPLTPQRRQTQQTKVKVVYLAFFVPKHVSSPPYLSQGFLPYHIFPTLCQFYQGWHLELRL